MNEKYIIKIYFSNRSQFIESSHYFGEITENSYYTKISAKEATKFTKECALNAVKSIEHVYKINPNNGNLSKIEILDADTLQIVNFNTIGEDEVPTSRFDLMDFEE